MKILKRLLIVSAGLLILLIVIPFVIPKKIYLSSFTRYVESHYPITLSLKDAHLSLVPALGIDLKGLTINIKTATETAPIIKASLLKTTLDWNSLIARHPILSLSMSDASIFVTQISPDEFNYDALLRSSDKSKNKSEDKSKKNLSIMVDTAIADHLKIHYKPYKEPTQEYFISHIALHGKKLSPPDYIFDVNLAAALQDIQIEGDFENSFKGSAVDIHSKNLTFVVPNRVQIKDAKFSVTGDWKQKEDANEFQNGKLNIGPQEFQFNAIHQKKGTTTAVINIQSLDLNYLKQILPPMASIPPMEGASLNANLIKENAGTKPAISGNFAAKSIQLSDERLEDVRTQFSYQDSSAKLSNLQAKVFGGTIKGSGDIDLSQAKPLYHLDLALQDVDLQDIPSVSGLISGKGDMTFKGEGRGFEKEEWSKALTGNGGLNARNVQIPALKLFDQIFSSPVWQMTDIIPGLAGAVDTASLQNLKKLDQVLSLVESSFQIAEGKIQVPRLNIPLTEATTLLEGSIGLDKSLDFHGTATLTPEIATKLIPNAGLRQVLAASNGTLVIPFVVNGAVLHPTVTLDEKWIQNGLQNFAKQEAENKAQEAAREILKPKPGEGIKMPSQQKIKDFLKGH